MFNTKEKQNGFWASKNRIENLIFEKKWTFNNYFWYIQLLDAVAWTEINSLFAIEPKRRIK